MKSWYFAGRPAVLERTASAARAENATPSDRTMTARQDEYRMRERDEIIEDPASDGGGLRTRHLPHYRMERIGLNSLSRIATDQAPGRQAALSRSRIASKLSGNLEAARFRAIRRSRSMP